MRDANVFRNVKPGDRIGNHTPSYFQSSETSQLEHWACEFLVLPAYLATTFLAAHHTCAILSTAKLFSPKICASDQFFSISNFEIAILLLTCALALLSISLKLWTTHKWWGHKFSRRGLTAIMMVVASLWIRADFIGSRIVTTPATTSATSQVVNPHFPEAAAVIWIATAISTLLLALYALFVLLTDQARRIGLLLILGGIALTISVYTIDIVDIVGMLNRVANIDWLIDTIILVQVVLVLTLVIRRGVELFSLGVFRKSIDSPLIPISSALSSWHPLLGITVFVVAFAVSRLTLDPSNFFQTHLRGAALYLALFFAMYLAGQPRVILSRFRTHFRDITANARHTTMRKYAAGSFGNGNFSGRVIQRVYFSQPPNSVKVMLAFVTLLICLEARARSLLPDTQIFDLVARSEKLSALITPNFGNLPLILFAIGAVGVAAIVVTISRRHQYIVIPFELEADGGSKPLPQFYASEIQHGLVEQVQEIGRLLQLRQAENVRLGSDAGLTHFVASSQNIEFTDELRSLTSLDIAAPDGKMIRGAAVMLSEIARSIYSRVAATRIQGGIRRRSDGGIHARLTLFRNGVTLPIESEISAIELTELSESEALRTLCRKLAILIALRLGNAYGIGSSAEALDTFLDGLRSAVDGKEWRAIASFRQSIQIEEAVNGAFGIAHFHLGTALISVGELDEGIRELERAAACDPLFAETNYMLALTEVHRDWAKLDDPSSAFDMALRRCQDALNLRPDFPEVLHLMGSMYYHKSKLLHRKATFAYRQPNATEPVCRVSRIKAFLGASTKAYESAIKLASIIAGYRVATRYYARALKAYDKRFRRLQSGQTTHADFRQELSRTFQARMTATHQMADSLRSQGHYQEAESNYDDFIAAFPQNMRTLIDLAKTYCLAETWQRADEFAHVHLLPLPEGTWNPDVHLHVGWILSGGLYAESGGIVPLLHKVPKFSLLVRLTHMNDTMQRTILAKATHYLDYAIRMRARYATRWAQTDWQTSFLRACQATRKRNRGPSDADLAVWSMAIDALKSKYEGSIRKDNANVSDHARIQKILLALKKEPLSLNTYNRISELYAQVKSHLIDAESFESTFSDILIQLRNLVFVDPVARYQYWLSTDLHGLEYQNLDDAIGAYLLCLPLWKAVSSSASIPQATTQWVQAQSSASAPQDSMPVLEPAPALAILGSYPNDHYAYIYQEFLRLQTDSAQLLYDIDTSGRLHGMSFARRKLRLAAQLLDTWKEAEKPPREKTETSSEYLGIWSTFDRETGRVEDPNKRNANKMNMGDRWAYAVFGKISMLTVRWLLESGAYETAWEVAHISAKHLWFWSNLHDEANRSNGDFETVDKPIYPIFPFSFRYTYATLLSYKSYAMVRMLDDREERTRVVVALEQPQEIRNYARLTSMPSVTETTEDIDLALDIMPRHPLALFVRAQLLKQQSLHDMAAIELNRLANIDHPFDPIHFVANWEFVRKPAARLIELTDYRKPELGSLSFEEFVALGDDYAKFRKTCEEKKLISSDIDKRRREDYAQLNTRRKMAFFEEVIGQSQIGHLVDQAYIHHELATIYASRKQQSLAEAYMQNATIWAEHRDEEAEYLVEFAETLERGNLFRDAAAVSAALQERQANLESQTLSLLKTRYPILFELMMNSRQWRYADALRVAEDVKSRWASNGERLSFALAGLGNLLFKNGYASRIDDTTSLWLYLKLCDFVNSEALKHRITTTAFDLPGVMDDSKPMLLWLAKAFLDPDTQKTAIKRLKGQCAWIKNHPPEQKDESAKAIANPWREEPPLLDVAWNISVRMLLFLCQEAVRFLEQSALLDNSIAYSATNIYGSSYAEGQSEKRASGAMSDSAPQPITSSIANSPIEAPSYKVIGDKNNALIDNAINVARFLLDSCSSHDAARRYRVLLRNLYDTRATIAFTTLAAARPIAIARRLTANQDAHFGTGLASAMPHGNVSRDLIGNHNELGVDSIKGKFAEAVPILTALYSAIEDLHVANSHDSNSSLVHARLAQLHLAMVEALWQSMTRIDVATVAQFADLFQRHLKDARNHWRIANELDSNDRLYNQLGALGIRIDTYALHWDERQLQMMKAVIPT